MAKPRHSSRKILETATAAAFDEAERKGFPAFLGAIAESSPLNATPYLVRYADFRERVVGWPGRARLAVALDDVRARAVGCGISVEAVLIGGSFTDLANPRPRDVDCLMLYRALPDQSVLADDLSRLQRRSRTQGVDVRFIPMDGDPLILVKSISYFTSLFAERYADPQKVHASGPRGLLLLDCAHEAELSS